MQESLFVLPEAFDDELLEEIAPYLDDPSILFVAGDLDEDMVFNEDEAVALLANYGQVVSTSTKRCSAEASTSISHLLPRAAPKATLTHGRL